MRISFKLSYLLMKHKNGLSQYLEWSVLSNRTDKIGQFMFLITDGD